MPHYLHIEEINSPNWHNHIYFRDYLRIHPEVVQEYLKLKKELAAKFATDRKAYTEGKAEFT